MKIFFAGLLLLVFAGLTYLSEAQDSSQSLISQPTSLNPVHTKQSFNFPEIANYNIKAELFPERKLIIVEEELIWINRTVWPTNEIQLHLYPNAFSNNHTLWAAGNNVHITSEKKSGINFSEILMNNKPVAMEYYQPEIQNPYDSTVARIKLDKYLLPGDSVRLFFKYILKVPQGIKGFSYNSDENFFFISQWFPKAGVFQEGKWICSQYHPFTGFYSDFARYKVQLTVPSVYVVGATGIRIKNLKKNYKTTYTFEQSGIHDFAWMASSHINEIVTSYRRNDRSDVIIRLLIQPENTRYTQRILEAIRNSFKFFEKNIGSYPYQILTVIDAPKTNNSGGMVYPTLFTINTELFSPIETLKPETMTIHEFCHQYFYGIVANNEVYEDWLDEGLASYLTTKIKSEYYKPASVHFKLAGFFPVFGLNLLSYNELPLLYSLGEFEMPEGATALTKYYNSSKYGSITDTSYILPDREAYGSLTYSKPELALLSLEHYLGYKKMFRIIKAYYMRYKFAHPRGVDFFNVLRENSREDLDWFIRSYFYKPYIADYKIRSITHSAEKDEYQIFIEKNGDAVFKQEIFLYTDKDILIKKWNGSESWKRIIFKTNNEVLGAEIDPFRKNLLDMNFANNSYTTYRQYGGTLRIATRWFFWVQNLFLILGSVA